MSHPRLGPLLLVVGPLLFGCTKVGPDFVRPSVAIEPRWIEAGDGRVKHEEPDKAWWHAFRDLVLDRLVERASRDNLFLRIAGVRVLEARAELGIATGGFYPQTQRASGYFQYNKQSERTPFATIEPRSLLEFDQAQIGLAASWDLDFWGKFWARDRVGRRDARRDRRRLPERAREPHGRRGEHLCPHEDRREEARDRP